MGKSFESEKSTSKRTSRPKLTRKKNEIKRTTINDESEVITNDRCSDLPVWNSNFWKIFWIKRIFPAQMIQNDTLFAAISQRFYAEIDFFFFCVGVCVGKIKAAYLRVWIYIEDSICFREIFFFLQHQIVSSILCLFFCLLHIIVDLVFVKIIHTVPYTVLYCV